MAAPPMKDLKFHFEVENGVFFLGKIRLNAGRKQSQMGIWHNLSCLKFAPPLTRTLRKSSIQPSFHIHQADLFCAELAIDSGGANLLSFA
jgi:hypothetical protein